MIKSVCIIANINKKEALSVANNIKKFLNEKNILVNIYKISEDNLVFQAKDDDLAITLGGDGTVLFTARNLKKDIPIMPINLGQIGFMAEIAVDEWEDILTNILSNKFDISYRLMLSVSLYRNGKLKKEWSALNDAVVCSSGISKLLFLDIEVDNKFLGVFKSDGVIISTPTGSTAYSAAAGGPIVDPEMDAFILTPICPFTLSNRPLVIPSEKSISIRLSQLKRVGALLTIDGQEVEELSKDDLIIIKKSLQKIKIVKNHKKHFYNILKDKLNWSGGLEC